MHHVDRLSELILQRPGGVGAVVVLTEQLRTRASGAAWPAGSHSLGWRVDVGLSLSPGRSDLLGSVLTEPLPPRTTSRLSC